jgi:hypothetical protein
MKKPELEKHFEARMKANMRREDVMASVVRRGLA